MIAGCSLLCSIQPYLWAYDPSKNKCMVRSHAVALWEVWSWTTEMLVFLVVPLVILIVNVLVMREVWRMSSAGPGAVMSAAARESTSGSRSGTELRNSSVYSGPTSKNAATNAMLLTVSFYVIFTTLPATLVYVLGNAFPEKLPTFRGACVDGPTTTGALEDPEIVAWQRYVAYNMVRKVVNEICLSHYACNFFFYVVTGREFRLALRRLFRQSVAEVNLDTDNGTLRCRQSVAERPLPGNDQRTLLARM